MICRQLDVAEYFGLFYFQVSGLVFVLCMCVCGGRGVGGAGSGEGRAGLYLSFKQELQTQLSDFFPGLNTHS